MDINNIYQYRILCEQKKKSGICSKAPVRELCVRYEFVILFHRIFRL